MVNVLTYELRAIRDVDEARFFFYKSNFISSLFNEQPTWKSKPKAASLVDLKRRLTE